MEKHPITLKMVATTCVAEISLEQRVAMGMPKRMKVHPVLVERFTDQGIIPHLEWPDRVVEGLDSKPDKPRRIDEVIINGYECGRCAAESAGVPDLETLIKAEREALDFYPPHLRSHILRRIAVLEHSRKFLAHH